MTLYTAFQKYIPKHGRAVSVVVEKNVRIAERFFDNHYKPAADGQISTYIQTQKSTE